MYSKSLSNIGKFYSRAIIDSKIEFDTVFDPAYKGIPLVTSTSIALLENGKNCKVSFNRKEKKFMVTQALYLAVRLMIELLYWMMLLHRDYQLMNQKI